MGALPIQVWTDRVAWALKSEREATAKFVETIIENGGRIDNLAELIRSRP